MNDLPEHLPMKPVLFGDGRNGSALQLLSNDEFDVLCFIVRMDHLHDRPFTETWNSSATGPLEFPSWYLLRRAMLDDRRDYDLMASGELRKHLHGYTIVAQVSSVPWKTK